MSQSNQKSTKFLSINLRGKKITTFDNGNQVTRTLENGRY